MEASHFRQAESCWWLVSLYVHRNPRFIRDGRPERAPRLSHGSWSLRSYDVVEVLLYVHRNPRFIRDGSPERPPRLSHSFWLSVAHTALLYTLCCLERRPMVWQHGRQMTLGTTMMSNFWFKSRPDFSCKWCSNPAQPWLSQAEPSQAYKWPQCHLEVLIVQELRESQGSRPGLSVLTSLLVSVDVKLYWTMLRHWSQLVPNMSTDIWGH